MIGKHLGRLLRLNQIIGHLLTKSVLQTTIAELACNKNLDEILDLQDLLKQSIRSHLSRLLLTP